MIGLLSLVAMQIASPPVVPSVKPSNAVTAGSLRKDCLAGIGSDAKAMERCTSALLAFARDLQDADPEASTCLGTDRGPASDLVWNWFEWTERNPVPDDADAGPSVTASILDRWPCGWSEG